VAYPSDAMRRIPSSIRTQRGALTSHWDAVRGSDISFRWSGGHPISSRGGEGSRHSLPMRWRASHLIRTQGGVLTSHWGAVMSPDIFIPMQCGRSHFPHAAVRRCGGAALPPNAVGGIPSHSDAGRRCGISLGRSEGFWQTHSDALRGTPPHPPAASGCGFPFRRDEEHPLHSEAVRGSDISLGPSEGF
jgi:hypothetical protein